MNKTSTVEKTFDISSLADKSVLIAILLWLLSLPLVAIVNYKGLEVFGIGLLLNGYWGAYYYNFGWFANAAFFITLFRYFEKSRPPAIWAIITVALSVQGLTFDYVYSGGKSAPLYGYGPGYVIWYVALLWLMFSVGLRGAEKRKIAPFKVFNCMASLALLVCFLSYATLQTITLRNSASVTEKDFIATHSVLYVRHAICSNELPTPKYKLELNGPLELIENTGTYPFDKVRIVLGWGFKSIRVGQFDYSFLHSPNGTRTLAATAKHGDPVGILRVIRKPIENSRGFTINIKLTDFKSGDEIFTETWENPKGHGSMICPRFKSLPDANELPRSLIVSAFSNLEIPTPERRESIADVTKEFIEATTLATPVTSHKDSRQCPEGMGYLPKYKVDSINETKPLAVKFNAAVTLDDQGYYFESGANQSLCVNESLYLYSIHEKKNSFYIRLAKKNSTNFHEHWFTEFSLSKTKHEIWAEPEYLAISEISDTEIIVNVINPEKLKKLSYRLNITI